MPRFLGGKWGEFRMMGTPGGVVTWSLVGPGVDGVNSFFTGRASLRHEPDLTTAPQRSAEFNIKAAVADAFAAWARFGNIDFVQVADDGASLETGMGANIRVSFGRIDGKGGRIAGLGSSPPFSPRFERPQDGNILVDAQETFFRSDPALFRTLILHEIGHALGLDHVSGPKAIMDVGDYSVSELQPDDIQGVQRLYGRQDRAKAELAVGDSPDIDILGSSSTIRLLGDERDNRIAGGSGRDILLGGDGDDLLKGRFGDDVARGGDGADRVAGGAGGDRLNGGAGDDIVRGGQGDDLLVGGGGADTLIGGAGDDRLRGGGDADVFMFRGAFGDDVVLDFDAGEDSLDFSRVSGVDGIADLEIRTVAAGLLIVAPEGSVLLRDVAEGDLSEANFIF